MFLCLQISPMCYDYSSFHSIFSSNTAFFSVFQNRAIFTWNTLLRFFKYWPLFILYISSNIVQLKLFLTTQTRNFQPSLLSISLPIYFFFTALIYTSNCFPSLYDYLLLICIDEVCRFYMAGQLLICFQTLEKWWIN